MGPARVLILCNSPDNGGGANLLFRVTKYLNQERVRPTLLLHKPGWPAAQQRRHGTADVIIDPDIQELDPIPSASLAHPLITFREVAAAGAGYGRVIRGIADRVRERGFDVLAGFGAVPGALATLGGTLARRPVVWNAQRCYDTFGAARPMQVLALLPAVKRIFAVSRAAAMPYHHVPEKLVINYNGMDPDKVDPRRIVGTLRARMGIGPEVPLVGMAGRVIRLKGVDLFLRAAARIAKRFPEVRFVIIGRREGDAFDRELDEITAAEGLSDRVVFTGWVDDILTEMIDLDIVAIPSRRDAAPLVAFEAMALGRPIVATRCPGLDEQLEPEVSGLYVPRQDVEALAGAILRLLGDGDLRLRLGRAAREALVSRFDLRHAVLRIEETLVRLARDPGACLD
mgnify:CR=1 FL=1